MSLIDREPKRNHRHHCKVVAIIIKLSPVIVVGTTKHREAATAIDVVAAAADYAVAVAKRHQVGGYVTVPSKVCLCVVIQ